MSHTDRLTVFLDDRDNRALRSARINDGVPASDRIRAAVQLWQQGGPASDRINSRAANLRRELPRIPFVSAAVTITNPCHSVSNDGVPCQAFCGDTSGSTP